MHQKLRSSIGWLLTILILCALPGLGGAQEAAPQDTLAACAGVVLGTQTYWQADPFEGTITETFMAPDIRRWYGWEFDTPLRFTAFAVTDLDKDGSPELLLQLSGDFGFELLHCYDGAVYGYPFVFRAMEAVTIDGEILGASGAMNYGWYTLAFDGIDMQRLSVCRTSLEKSNTIRCTIGGEVVGEAAFNALNDALWEKDQITWTDFSPDALHAAILGEISQP